ncbi:outer membrane protein assembly factor BamB family protein [Lignipirellula cremea]|uniref:Serine/threonine-protein kinase AfsK n=1 Tax=Lignipirellula cremea TaxID=2528010 RepID=A0A518DN45_9BACT|nr:PQQ-binding-like beta-propeller repeat protein [Lignipirellula cremea]QDU93260.1 Serine/threonine-protein kinase AfsK [Lignipirellula cremea]
MISCKPCLGLLLLTLLPGLEAAAADWPTWLNSNARAGAGTEQLSPEINLHWAYTSPAPPEMAWAGPADRLFEGKLMRHRVDFDQALAPVVVDGRLFFGSMVDHQLHCVDAKSGAPLWNYFTDGAIRLAPTVHEGKVYFGSDDGCVYCLAATDGKLVWKLRVAPVDERLLGRGRMISRWPVRTGVLIEDGVAYFGAGVFPHENVYLCAADAASGRLIWRNDRISQENAGRNDLSPQGYLLAQGDVLFVPSARSLPAAFNKQTGEEIFHKTYSWRTDAGGVVGGAKAVLGDGQIYAAGDEHFLAMNQETGVLGHAWIGGRQLAISNRQGFIADGKKVVAIDRAEHAAATVARQAVNLEIYALGRRRSDMPAAEYQRLYVELKERAAKLSDVGVLWSVESSCDASLIVSGDWVVAGGVDKVEAYRVSDGQSVWSAAVEGEASSLVGAAGGLIVSTSQGKIYGYFPGKEAAPTPYPLARTDQPYAADKLTDMYQTAAAQILEQSGVRRGFCLVAGGEQGRLAYELARQSDLRIYCVESDPAKITAAQTALDKAGLYGSRITFIHASGEHLPLSNYFANLIVSDTLLLTGQVPVEQSELDRCLKPCGGKQCWLVPPAAPGAGQAAAWLTSAAVAIDRGELAGQNAAQKTDGSLVVAREKLLGAGDWSHQYGDTSNTMMSSDYRVKGSLGVLWYGDPGPAAMINRHDAAAAPLSTNGRMFIQGFESILCYDAYNGLFLWEVKNPGALRTGVFNNEETSNLAASDDWLFVAVDNQCTQYDAATGKIVAVYETPPAEDQAPRHWGYVAVHDGMLYGASTLRSELAAALRRRGHQVKSDTDAFFAIDLKTQKRSWIHRGQNILHVTIALNDGKAYFIDSSITAEARSALLAADKTELQNLTPEEAKKKEAELKALDVRTAVALDAKTGELLWSKAVDVTDCSRIGIGGGNLTLMVHDDCVLICGANANGHYWRQFLSGQFNERRLLVLDADTGKKLWSKDANYRHRPIIVDNEIYAEPWAFALRSGEQKMRAHPLTGEQTAWQFSRPGHHCGPITATPNMLLFRSGFTGYYDLYSDSGVSHFAGHRTGCWVNVIPGNGLVMIPEASAGCVCQFSIAATVVLEPRENRGNWRIYSSSGDSLPVKQMNVNLGAPGDRRDSLGQLWLAWPRPNLVGRLELDLDVEDKLAPDGEYYAQNEESLTIEGEAAPWVFNSGAQGLQSLQLPLRGPDDGPGVYTVKLSFADLQHADAGQRQFAIRLQGQTVAADFDVAALAGGSGKPLVRIFKGIEVKDKLLIELPASSGSHSILSGIEVTLE